MNTLQVALRLSATQAQVTDFLYHLRQYKVNANCGDKQIADPHWCYIWLVTIEFGDHDGVDLVKVLDEIKEATEQLGE